MRTQQEVSALAQPRPWWWNGVVGVEESGEEDGVLWWWHVVMSRLLPAGFVGVEESDEDEDVGAMVLIRPDEPLPWWWDVLFIDAEGHIWINEENFVMIRLEECVHLSPDTEPTGACVHQ